MVDNQHQKIKGYRDLSEFVWKCNQDAGLIAEQIPRYWMPLPAPPVSSTQRSAE